MFGEGVLESFLNYAPENYFLRRFEEEGQIRPLGIRGEGLFKHIVEIYKKQPELLEKIGEKLRLIGWFQGFEVPKDLMFTERRINIKDKYLQELDFFDQRSANEGFLFLLFYFTLFISPFTPKFFAIDNIDNALNPKLCAELTKQLAILAKENDKQAILTTHNPAILDGLDLTDDSQRLFTIYRNADGHTVAKRIKAPKKVKGVEPIRLSEAYIRGYLGGLPQNF
ncbi:MAG: AAA family ATPase [Chitinophagales bacterium]